MAQLGARLNGIQKVRGSNPLISTNKKEASNWKGASFFLLSGAEAKRLYHDCGVSVTLLINIKWS